VPLKRSRTDPSMLLSPHFLVIPLLADYATASTTHRRYGARIHAFAICNRLACSS
jgi:hypothetical protein